MKPWPVVILASISCFTVRPLRWRRTAVAVAAACVHTPSVRAAVGRDKDVRHPRALPVAGAQVAYAVWQVVASLAGEAGDDQEGPDHDHVSTPCRRHRRRHRPRTGRSRRRPDDSRAPRSCNSVGYQAYVQSVGWQPTVTSGATAGTTGRALRLEAFRLTSPALTYRAFVQGTGWQPWVSTGEVAGVPGGGLRLEALAIYAPADAPYRVEYRSNVATLGWQPWVHDGRTTGRPVSGLRIEAIQVRLVEKAPPVTDR